MHHSNEEESRIAFELKKTCCNEAGKEIDSQKSAYLLHKLGLLYGKRSPDKISLLKSVGLLNAAIARKPHNAFQIMLDLNETCKHILNLAKAQNQNVDLVKKADDFKMSIVKLRKDVIAFLDSSVVKKIPPNQNSKTLRNLEKNKVLAIEHLNLMIAERYTQLMMQISQFCQEILGRPPCEYALIGMGSLARKEITPYSDFEHIIVLLDEDRNESELEYFRYFSVIFHVVVLNLQETIIPSLNVFSLNDSNSSLGDWFYDIITPRGISFDGMMPHACKYPLGRQQKTQNKPWATELILPVSKMLNYLSSGANPKNGYHLADILSKTCFVFGKENIFMQFEIGAQSYQAKKTKDEIIAEVSQQVKRDLDNFSTRFRLSNLFSANSINIKQLVYRSTTIFIAALGKINNISANSCFHIVKELAKKKIITQKTEHKLLYAVAIACEMRIRVYAAEESQCDNAFDLKHDHQSKEKFLDIVGVSSTFNYFQIAYCLQCELAKQLNFTKFHFYSDPQLINFTISYAFDLTQNFTVDLPSVRKSSSTYDLTSFDFDASIELLEKEQAGNVSTLGKKKACNQLFSGTNLQKAEQLTSIADRLYLAKIYDEALEFYRRLLQIYETESNDTANDRFIAISCNNVGLCLKHVHQYKDAMSHFMRVLEIFEKKSSDYSSDGDIAMTLNNIGNCLMDMQQYDEAMEYLNKALLVHQNRSLGERVDECIAETLNNLGNCAMHMQRYGDAFDFLTQALDIQQRPVTIKESSRINVAATLNNLGNCTAHLKQYQKALTYLKQGLEIKQNLSHDESSDKNVANILNNIANCFSAIGQYDNALNYYFQARNIYRKISLDFNSDAHLADVQHNIELCQKKFGSKEIK